MSELKPCPFCGGTSAIVERYEHHEGQWRYRVVCPDCMGQVDSGWWQNAAQAIEAWNRRTEGTCHDVTTGNTRCSAR